MSADAFFAGLSYQPDSFQESAAAVIERGESVVVSAPTGSGKTLVAEVALHLAVERGGRAFYTTPIKALSNQKYREFSAVYGSDNVGLLTGDNSINAPAQIVVMTTEVLRNMIYAESPWLSNVICAVLDEVHYLADRFRGSVWEEVIIHAPSTMQLVCLSATVANADEFTDWIASRRGATQLVTETHRPVPLEPLFMVTDLWSKPKDLLFPMFVEKGGQPTRNPQVQNLLAAKKGKRRRFTTPRRPEVIERLASESMLPVIYFIFSRAGCESSARNVAAAKLRLTTAEERQHIRHVATEKTHHLQPGDLNVLGFENWLADLEEGVAAHHAGMVPAFKETVEELFAEGLLKVVFATETLALGINMPARSVVIDSLSKYNGESHELLGPNDYTQLTGRAGRRGIDTVGYGITLYSRFLRFERMTDIAAAVATELRSSFRPTYNMTVNLVANYTQERAEELLETSFAAFQAQRDREDRQDRVAGLTRELERMREAAKCELGSVENYVKATKQTDGASPDDLRPGHVIRFPNGPNPGRYMLLAHKSGDTPIVMLSARGKIRSFGAEQMVGAIRLGKLDVPKAFRPRDKKYQQKIIQRLKLFRPSEEVPLGAMPDHPVAGCSELAEHMAAQRKVAKLTRRLDRMSGKTDGLVATFRSVLAVLEQRGYTDGWSLTEQGERLRRVYSEMDLLISETLESGCLLGSSGPDLASVVSAFIYESRSDGDSAPVPLSLEPVFKTLDDLWAGLAGEEAKRDLSTTRRPDPALAELTYHWCQGIDLDELTDETSMAVGDFVRVARQIIDVLRQIRDADPRLTEIASDAMRRLNRGVVAAGGQL